ncbi:DUF4394 domain-containing protein [Dyadobacter tibetensis]|uniref:DUF4394 domain-containing protein n=1 Tax=Dyadobacter tibetensis TaxID=1211851 RepID=UPI000471EAFB|nr:DUF4394 domain-containing protein [Dyadobacter tibetensis]
MKFFNTLFQHANFLIVLGIGMALSSCQDHRLEPDVQTLPDRIFYALSDDNKLHEMNIKNTSMPERSFLVSGLEPGDQLAGIDFRPATGQLYAISMQGNLYHINVRMGDQQGKATRIGTAPIASSLNGAEIGFDFNPTVDRIRVVTSSGQNMRLHPETGAIVPGDNPLNGPVNPMVGAVAYTNSRAGASTTALYDIDASTDMLYMQNPPNPGALISIGMLGLDIEAVGGFDISPDEDPSDIYPIVSVKVGGQWELDLVDLATGRLQKLGNLPSGVNVIGLAIPALPVGYALNMANGLTIFNPITGQVFANKVVSGLPAAVFLEGIDLRPVDGKLHALGSDSKIYGIDLASAAATVISSLQLADGSPVMIMGSNFGVDFNPVADRLRVVSNTGQNLRINVHTGVTILDGDLKIGVGGVTPFVTACAYTNSYPGVSSTMLYDIDSKMDMLFKQNPPNDGILVEGKPLGIDAVSEIGFDIGNGAGAAYGIITAGGSSHMYQLDLSTGTATPKYTFAAPAKGLALGFGL